MANSDEILAELKNLSVKLYGENGFEGDIIEIKKHCKETNDHFEDHSKRITVIETRMEDHQTSIDNAGKLDKKTIAGYSTAIVGIIVALWKAFNNGG